MEDGLLPWSDFLENQLTKPLGSPLGVNQMRIKRNDHTPKSAYSDLFFKYMSQNNSFEKKEKINIFFGFSCLHFLFSKEIFIKNTYVKTFLYHGALVFFLLEHLFYLSDHKTRWTMSVENLDLEICLLGTLNFMITLAKKISWCKPKWSRMSSSTNHMFYKALG